MVYARKHKLLSPSVGKKIEMFEFIMAVSDMVLEMINDIDHDKHLVLSEQ